MPKSKLTTLDEFKALLKDGMTIMVGGFMTDGTPEQLINAVVESGVKNLTLINNDGGYPERGIGKLIANGQVKKLIASHVGLNPTVAKLMNSGEMEVDLVPQGTLAERIRAKGAGLGGILTQTGLGTLVQEGKQVVESEGKKYLLEVPLAADLAIIEATYADKFGNGVNIGTTRNFNPLMALAADKVVLGTYKLQELGEVDPSSVTIYGVLVDHIVQIEEM
ncbi:MAG: 3-oxoacid CoA-transferase subunit A [Burkholderiales bacterium]|jgi:acetate CoA/acetoacetate CoA-transferase alpha subunit|nr:3-oxoacid CoA-transferase subunit A [Burkholderiales bacterium]